MLNIYPTGAKDSGNVCSWSMWCFGKSWGSGTTNTASPLYLQAPLLHGSATQTCTFSRSVVDCFCRQASESWNEMCNCLRCKDNRSWGRGTLRIFSWWLPIWQFCNLPCWGGSKDSMKPRIAKAALWPWTRSGFCANWSDSGESGRSLVGTASPATFPAFSSPILSDTRDLITSC